MILNLRERRLFVKRHMHIRKLLYTTMLAGVLLSGPVNATESAPHDAKPAEPETAQPTEPTECFESREGYTAVPVEKGENGTPNVKCSKRTNGVLWWGDPYYGTEQMGPMPIEADYTHEEAVVKPRTKQLKYFMPCSTCHNGQMVPFPKDKKPRLIQMHQDIVPDSMDLKHGRGAIWCLDCHNPTNRDTLISHQGDEISFNQPQKLCGKCHGEVYIDWRDGIHGKRIGQWTKGGKKRWWVCTECHNPHMVQVNRFQPLVPEPAPALPRGMKNADHEKPHGTHGGGSHSEAQNAAAHTEAAPAEAPAEGHAGHTAGH